VSSFNNAGFSTYSGNLVGFATDPLFLLPVILAVVVGGLGIPVFHDLRRHPLQMTRWSIHTKVTVLGTAVLLLGGAAVVLAFEASNPATFGPFDLQGKMLASVFHSAMTRAAGFNSVPIEAMRPETLTFSYGLMLIGGGSAGTAGGIKVTTFFLLGFVVWAEIRGNSETNLFNRCVSVEVQRQALTVVLLAVGTVAVSTLALLCVTDFGFAELLFEAISAFCTVGLTTGLTPDLPVEAQLMIIGLMFFGRVGTVSVATALALRKKQRHYRYPEERLVVG
jgi:Trk-type K+ transport system membrane component